MIVGREIKPAYIAFSLGALLTFVFVSLITIRDPSHLRSHVANFQDKVKQLKYGSVVPEQSEPSTDIGGV
jgi:hypothetical protein